ncbi:MAG: Thivi_2564 family membrane protein, partial [Beijerinckiaceae bacterium]|nr:Thivi_2564 family membrane protein [Beijerinckiaceae bacterium]
MPLVNLVITLIVVGVLLWLVNTYIPMDHKIKRILNVVVVIAVVLWLLQAFG